LSEAQPQAEPQPASILDAQVEALLERIAADRDRRCAELRESTERQARDLKRSAIKEARGQVHEAVKRERKHAEQTLRQAQASADLQISRRAQQATRELLKAMWAVIGAALEARWADSVRRRDWVRAAIKQAQRLLTEPAWRIEHGAGWSEAECALLAKLAAGGEGREPQRKVELACDPSVHAGIRIRTSGATFDATAVGLLAVPSLIESEFLAQHLALSATPAAVLP